MGMPSNVGYGRVEGRLIRAVLDGPDENRTPDGVPLANATVTFTADVTHARNKHAVPPVMIFFDTISVRTDDDGMLVSPDGQQGVWLVAVDDADIDPMIGAYTLTAAAPVYYATISVARPFVAPSGWGFVPHIVKTARYPYVAVSNPTSSVLEIRYAQIASSAVDGSLVIGWRLVQIA